MIGSLQTVRLPSPEFRRDYIVPQALHSPEVEGQYDFQTLVYDAFYLSRKRSICVICPKLLNFESLLRQGIFTADGDPLRISAIWHFKRFSQVWLRYARKPAQLRFQSGAFGTTLPIQDEQSDLFRGLNCAVTLSKDNDLQWVRDWAHYNVQVHGLQALVFFDNNSSRYEPTDLLATLRSVSGVQQALVIPAPLPYGCTQFGDARFLQVALLNIARLRFFSSAAAVLCTDIDELVAPVAPSGIFAATRRSPLGYLLFRGRWRDAKAPPHGERLRHGDHVYRHENDRHVATKYCINPQGPCGFSHWDVHGAVRGFLKTYLTTSKVEYWHCRQLSTNWGEVRSTIQADGLVIAPETAKIFAECFATNACAV